MLRGGSICRIIVNDPQRPSHFTGIWTKHRSYGARIETEYVDGVPNGIYRYWHEHGVCLREGCKKNGVWHGTLITRSTDDAVLDVSQFDEGTGVYRIFNSKHQLMDEVPMLNGKPHGLVRCWRRGNAAVALYENGERTSAVGEA